MEATKGLDQRDIKGDTKDFYIFDSWFNSKSPAEATMDVCSDVIGMTKNNTKVLRKYAIDNLNKDWPGGSHLMLKRNSTVPRENLLITIGYKYNYWEALYFIATEEEGRKKGGIPYYLSTLTRMLMFSFALLNAPLSCVLYLGMLMSLTPTTKPYSTI